MYKARHVRTTFGRSDFVSRGRRKGLCTLSKCDGFVAFPKMMAGMVHLNAKMHFPWQAQYKRHVQRC